MFPYFLSFSSFFRNFLERFLTLFCVFCFLLLREFFECVFALIETETLDAICDRRFAKSFCFGLAEASGLLLLKKAGAGCRYRPHH